MKPGVRQLLLGGNRFSPNGNRYSALTKGDQFDDAIWLKVDVTITANAATAPNGATAADKMIEAATTNVHRVRQAVATAGAYRVSVYAKAAERDQIWLNSADAAGGIAFNLTTGTAASGGVIEPAGDGWYRCTTDLTLTTQGLYIGILVVNQSYTGNGTSGVLLWGAQAR